MLVTPTTSDIRQQLADLLTIGSFVSTNREATMTALTGSRTIEIVGASFKADEDSIFGDVNWDYVKRDEEWYNSQSLSVNDIPGGAPQVWQAVADKDGLINSNYGWCIYSADNGSQYDHAVAELRRNPESRRATMIYTRPSMWLDYNRNGRSDFMCTSTVQYVIRDGAVHAIVQMRSNDAVFGYKNDRAWQHHVLQRVATDLGVPCGDITWQVGSLHVYARHFYLVHNFALTGEPHITKADYTARYPTSPFLL
jgi:thymidylate synthase